jgi:hypothetical protein
VQRGIVHKDQRGRGQRCPFDMMAQFPARILCEFHVESPGDPYPALLAAIRELDGTPCAGSKIKYVALRRRSGMLQVTPQYQNPGVIASTMRELILLAQPSLSRAIT